MRTVLVLLLLTSGVYADQCAWSSLVVDADSIPGLSVDCASIFPGSEFELQSDGCTCVAEVRLVFAFDRCGDEGVCQGSGSIVSGSTTGVETQRFSGRSHGPDALMPVQIYEASTPVDCGQPYVFQFKTSCRCSEVTSGLTPDGVTVVTTTVRCADKSSDGFVGFCTAECSAGDEPDPLVIELPSD